MKATIQLTEGDLKSAICSWLITEYGISVNATNDIKITDYCEEYLGDPQYAPINPETRYGAEVRVQGVMLKKGR